MSWLTSKEVSQPLLTHSQCDASLVRLCASSKEMHNECVQHGVYDRCREAFKSTPEFLRFALATDMTQNAHESSMVFDYARIDFGKKRIIFEMIGGPWRARVIEFVPPDENSDDLARLLEIPTYRNLEVLSSPQINTETVWKTHMEWIEYLETCGLDDMLKLSDDVEKKLNKNRAAYEFLDVVEPFIRAHAKEMRGVTGEDHMSRWIRAVAAQAA